MRTTLADLEVLTTQAENFAHKSDLKKVDDKFKLFAPLKLINDLKTDMLSLTKHEEFEILESQVKSLIKGQDGYLSKKEYSDK